MGKLKFCSGKNTSVRWAPAAIISSYPTRNIRRQRPVKPIGMLLFVFKKSVNARSLHQWRKAADTGSVEGLSNTTVPSLVTKEEELFFIVGSDELGSDTCSINVFSWKWKRS